MMNSSSCGDVDGVYFLRYFLIVGIPSVGSMFVYIEMASDVRIFEPGGKGPCCFSFLMTWNEFFT